MQLEGGQEELEAPKAEDAESPKAEETPEPPRVEETPEPEAPKAEETPKAEDAEAPKTEETPEPEAPKAEETPKAEDAEAPKTEETPEPETPEAPKAEGAEAPKVEEPAAATDAAADAPADAPATAAADAPAAEEPAARRGGFFSLAKGQLSKVASTVAAKSRKVIDTAAAEEITGDVEAPTGINFPGVEMDKAGPWTWKDLPRAFMALFDLRRVLFTTVGLWIGLIVFGLIQWLAAWGEGIHTILGSVISIIAWGALIAIGAYTTSVMGFVIQRTVMEQQRTTFQEGINWTKRWMKSVVGTPLAFLGLVGAVALIMVILGLVAHIPGIGAPLYGFLSLAVVPLGLIAGAVMIAAAYSLPLYLPVIYHRQSSPKETLRYLVGLFKDHGSKLIAHVLLSVAMIGATAAVTLYPIVSMARLLTGGTARYALGSEMVEMAAAQPSGFACFNAFSFGMTPTTGVETTFADALGGFFLGLGSASGLALILAVLLLSYTTAGAIIYNIVTEQQKPTPKA